MFKIYEAMDAKDNNIYSLEALIFMHDEDYLNYSYVSKRLCCPCCLQKSLVVNINDHVAFLKTDHLGHEDWCDYYGIKVKQSMIKKELKKGNVFEKEFLDVINNTSNKPTRLPKKNIERSLCADDFDVYKIFYGNVIIKKAHSKDKKKYLNYSLKAPKGDIINITISANVINHAQKIILELEKTIDKMVYVYLMGKIIKKDNYYNMVIDHSMMIKIKGGV